MNKSKLTEAERQELLARIKKNYDYHGESGLLVNRLTGKVVRGGKIMGKRYRFFSFWHQGKCGQLYYHWAVWAWHHGRFPDSRTDQIDHIDGDETNNRIENLRVVNGHENRMNMLLGWRPNAVTGLPGVTPNKHRYLTAIHGKDFSFNDAAMAFYHAAMCGKRYRMVKG